MSLLYIGKRRLMSLIIPPQNLPALPKERFKLMIEIIFIQYLPVLLSGSSGTFSSVDDRSFFSSFERFFFACSFSSNTRRRRDRIISLHKIIKIRNKISIKFNTILPFSFQFFKRQQMLSIPFSSWQDN